MRNFFGIFLKLLFVIISLLFGPCGNSVPAHGSTGALMFILGQRGQVGIASLKHLGEGNPEVIDPQADILKKF